MWTIILLFICLTPGIVFRAPVKKPFQGVSPKILVAVIHALIFVVILNFFKMEEPFQTTGSVSTPEIRAIEQSIASIQSTIDSSTAGVASATANLGSATATVANLQSLLSTVQSQITTANNNISTNMAHLRTAQNNVASAQSVVTNLQASYTSNIQLGSSLTGSANFIQNQLTAANRTLITNNNIIIYH